MSQTLARLRGAVERVRTEPGLGRNVIAVAAVLALGLGVGAFILGNQQYNPPWRDDTLVWATFGEVVGAAPGRGQEVRISGVRVGDVRDMRTNDRGQAELLLAIRKDDYDRPIHDNASFVLRPKSPLNEMYVEVDPGAPPGSPVPEEGVLPVANSRSPIQIDQPLSHLDDRTRDALQAMLSASDQALARAPRDLPGGVGATTETLKTMRPVVEQLDQRRAKLKNLVTSLAQLSQAFGHSDEQLASLTSSLHTTLRSVSANSDELRAGLGELPGLTKDLGTAGRSVQRLSGQLDPTLDNVRKASDRMPKALRRVTGTVGEVDGVLGKAGPVAQKLRPVVRDLRPFVGDLAPALRDLSPIARQLGPITKAAVPYLPDLEAFVYQTNSLTSLRDANGGILRGLVQFGPASLPIEGLDDLSPTQR